MKNLFKPIYLLLGSIFIVNLIYQIDQAPGGAYVSFFSKIFYVPSHEGFGSFMAMFVLSYWLLGIVGIIFLLYGLGRIMVNKFSNTSLFFAGIPGIILSYLIIDNLFLKYYFNNITGDWIFLLIPLVLFGSILSILFLIPAVIVSIREEIKFKNNIN